MAVAGESEIGEKKKTPVHQMMYRGDLHLYKNYSADSVSVPASSIGSVEMV